MQYALIYSARIPALIIRTVLGVFLATFCAILARLHYEMLGVTKTTALITGISPFSVHSMNEHSSAELKLIIRGENFRP
jgi:hypothetical protein